VLPALRVAGQASCGSWKKLRTVKTTLNVMELKSDSEGSKEVRGVKSPRPTSSNKMSKRKKQKNSRQILMENKFIYLLYKDYR